MLIMAYTIDYNLLRKKKKTLSFLFNPYFVEALSRKRIGLLSMVGVYVVLGVGIVVAFLTLMPKIS